jgi:hypothetical protein
VRALDEPARGARRRDSGGIQELPWNRCPPRRRALAPATPDRRQERCRRGNRRAVHGLSVRCPDGDARDERASAPQGRRGKSPTRTAPRRQACSRRGHMSATTAIPAGRSPCAASVDGGQNGSRAHIATVNRSLPLVRSASAVKHAPFVNILDQLRRVDALRHARHRGSLRLVNGQRALYSARVSRVDFRQRKT